MSKKDNLKAVLEIFMDLVDDSNESPVLNIPEISPTINPTKKRDEPYLGKLNKVFNESSRIVDIMDKVDDLDKERANELKVKRLAESNKRLKDLIEDNREKFEDHFTSIKNETQEDLFKQLQTEVKEENKGKQLSLFPEDIKDKVTMSYPKATANVDFDKLKNLLTENLKNINKDDTN